MSQNDDCLFCKIIRGEIPSSKVFENDNLYAFKDINPAAPTHVLIIPKKHIATMYDLEPEDSAILGEMMSVGAQIAKESPEGENGSRFVVNCNSWGGQEVYHLHLHVMAGKKLKSGLG